MVFLVVCLNCCKMGGILWVVRVCGFENGIILFLLSLNRNGVWMFMFVGDIGVVLLGWWFVIIVLYLVLWLLKSVFVI